MSEYDETRTYTCPVCGDNVAEDMVNAHLVDAHPLFLAIVQTIFLPPPLEPIPFLNYEDTYEDLSELCDMMGNVEIGVKNIDTVTDVIVCDTEDICPICLETCGHNGSCEYIRKIRVCEHRFCGACIETWLERHKTCPVCKVEVQP
jgi:hypothetical protein